MKSIKVTDLKKKLETGEALLVDVREPSEYAAEHIEGSCHIPLGEISLDKLPKKSGAIVIHCKSGMRSSTACQKLLNLDPNLELYTLEGGIMAWKDAGYTVKHSPGAMISIERQVQIIAGTLVTMGVFLGSTVNSSFYGLAAFIGLGLIFAGVSGWCGMAKFLATMPWNK